jgi:hypothetical protein
MGELTPFTCTYYSCFPQWTALQLAMATPSSFFQQQANSAVQPIPSCVSNLQAATLAYAASTQCELPTAWAKAGWSCPTLVPPYNGLSPGAAAGVALAVIVCVAAAVLTWWKWPTVKPVVHGWISEASSALGVPAVGGTVATSAPAAIGSGASAAATHTEVMADEYYLFGGDQPAAVAGRAEAMLSPREQAERDADGGDGSGGASYAAMRE